MWLALLRSDGPNGDPESEPLEVRRAPKDSKYQDGQNNQSSRNANSLVAVQRRIIMSFHQRQNLISGHESVVVFFSHIIRVRCGRCS
jgi:hypothetical protein